MRTIGELNAYILGCLQNEEAGRVALYHYTKNFCDEAAPLTPEVINAFFGEALQLPHWQEKASELYYDIQDLLQRFGAQTHFTINLGHLWNLPRVQLVTLKHIESLSATVKSALKPRLQEGDDLRLINDGDSRVISIRRHAQGFDVKTFNTLVRIEGEKLVPLTAEQELFYDQGLELIEGIPHRLRPTLHSQVRFVLTPDGVDARFISGYALRQSQALRLESLFEDPRIFFPLKKLERFYIFRTSDPFYSDLITTLDRAIYLIKNNDENAAAYARESFEKGQIAFDQIFPDDRPLHSRLSELVRLMPSPL